MSNPIMSRPSSSFIVCCSLFVAAAACDDGGDDSSARVDDVGAADARDADAASGDVADDGSGDTWGESVRVSGNAFVFGPPGGRVEGATITVIEHPDLEATTDEDGYWEVDVPSGSRATFVLEHENHAPYQTATFDVVEPMERVSLQTPTWDMVGLLEGMADTTRESDKCQIAATVTRRGHSLYDADGGTHGEPGATVSLTPNPDAADGPVYFNLVNAGVIYPDRVLEETTDDGGVLFLNVTPGEYVLSAEKDGADIADANILCRAGWIVNASPPWGLQTVEGGLEPRTN